MASGRTHYDVLGVGRDASSVDIASAFRDKLSELQSKPGVAPEAIDALRDAYQTLASPARRDEYDSTLAPTVVRSARAARQLVADDEPRGFMQSKLVRFGIPLAVVFLAVWGWKSRKPPAPTAQIVSRTQLTPPEASSEAAAPSQAPRQNPGAASSLQSPGPVSRSAEHVFAEASGSVVRVSVADSGGRVIQQGSGVVIGRGRVITNCHVTKGGAKVSVHSGANSRAASVAVADEELDLCSLDVAALDAPAVAVGTVSSLKTGQRVYAIGAPMGLELTISEGIVSSLREVDGGTVIQTTAPVSPGSSGGGLFNSEGKLVGVVTFQHRYGQNLNFAVPVDWIETMRTRGPIAAAAPARSSPVAETLEEMVVGKWWCFGSISGRNGEYTYGSDGVLRIVANDGRNLATRYRLSGRRIDYMLEGNPFHLEIESLTRDRMVQLVGDGHRLACERRT